MLESERLATSGVSKNAWLSAPRRLLIEQVTAAAACAVKLLYSRRCMFDEEAEVRLSPGGRTVRIVRSSCVWRPTDAAQGLVEVRFEGTVSRVPAHHVHRLSPHDAQLVAERLLSHSAATFGFHALSQAQRSADALADLLERDFVAVEVDEHRYTWSGPPVPPRPTPPPLEPTTLPALTWIGVSVVDADEPARTFAGAQFRLRLPDSATRSGALDGTASVRVDDIEAGKGWFELVDIPRDPSP